MKKFTLIFGLVPMLLSAVAYADEPEKTTVLPEVVIEAPRSPDGDDGRVPVNSTMITSSDVLTQDILPLSFELMNVVWNKNFSNGQCTVFQNTDLLTPFATECISVPFSALKLLDMCKEQVEKHEIASTDEKIQCMPQCAQFVMSYLHILVENDDLVSPTEIK